MSKQEFNPNLKVELSCRADLPFGTDMWKDAYKFREDVRKTLQGETNNASPLINRLPKGKLEWLIEDLDDFNTFVCKLLRITFEDSISEIMEDTGLENYKNVVFKVS